MAEFITVGELASYPGIQLGTEATNTLLVNLANGLITDIIGTLTPIPTRVKTIAFEAVARALRNPEGYTSETESLDDWSHTVRREGGDAAADAGVYLTTADELYLLGLLGLGPRRARPSIRTTVPGYGTLPN